MTIPTKKQLLVQSLKALSKARMRMMFRLRALRSRRKNIGSEELDTMKKLLEVNKKMAWELSHNGKALNDKN